ncbi:MAG: T9SS type A sorting domain-containing protein [Ignavibacteriaceae bacterium]|nr:T9SS type A sorting domain-containing protein [Ignavibacteriaceae bacterium]
MKSIYFCFLFVPIIFLQGQNLKQIKQELLKQNIEIESYNNSDSLLLIKYPGGKSIVKGIYPEQGNLPVDGIDTVVIDVLNVDTLLYHDRYTFWKEVNATCNQVSPVLVGDANKNGFAEVYGNDLYFVDDSWLPFPAKIFEYDPVIDDFIVRHIYIDTLIQPITLYDIDDDGDLEVYIQTFPGGRYGFVMTGSSNSSFPVNEMALNDMGYQMNDRTFGDFNLDDNTDLVYYSLASPGRNFIKTVNSQQNGFDSVFEFRQEDVYSAGFSAEDIDGDGYADIVLGNVKGKIQILEYSPVLGTYTNSWTGTVGHSNPYMHTASNDIDGNGRKEFWVGGDAFRDGVGVTRFTAFEATGDNQFEPVARIEIPGIFSFAAYNMLAKDITGDGVDELIICLDGVFFILTFRGFPNAHNYALYYVKFIDRVPQGVTSQYYGGTMYDIDGDGRMEIIISQDYIINNFGHIKVRKYSKIYRTTIGTSVNDEILLPDNYSISAFPNPFNSTQTFEVTVPQHEGFEVVIYDIMGRQIITLAEGNSTGNRERFNWNGKDETGTNVSSGVYIVRLQTKIGTKQIKSVLLK